MIFHDILHYKPDLQHVIRRYRDLYEHPEKKQMLVYAMLPFENKIPVPALNSLNLQKNIPSYLDICLKNYEHSLEGSRTIEDDLIPTFGINFGTGEYSAFVAGEVVFTQDTSWATSVIQEWNDLKKLKVDEGNRWVVFMEETLRYVLQFTQEGPIPVVRGFYSPLDLAHALRGEMIFTDLYDAPKEVEALLDFCADAIIWLAKRIHGMIGTYWDGSVAGGWLKPGTICMSEDIACLISPKTYARQIRPYTQKVINAFGNGQIHTHSLGLRTLPEITKLDHLLGVQIAEDPNTPRTMSNLEKVLETANDVPLTITCTFEEMKEKIDVVAGRYNIVFGSSANNVEDCEAIVRWIRERG
ncbi:MAG TPA: uroporphyrinogen decarboxylase family protein [Anaerolineaceae bacterium]|nr:uroporphyrinogen decarboxylase family protein [Anaerolineaceae bacterium]